MYCVLQRDEPIDDRIRQFIQPHIVAVGELFHMGSLHIACEGTILCTLPRQQMCNAIIALLACFYIFNIEYKCAQGILNFLEKSVVGLRNVSNRVAVDTFINSLSKL